MEDRLTDFSIDLVDVFVSIYHIPNAYSILFLLEALLPIPTETVFREAIILPLTKQDLLQMKSVKIWKTRCSE